MTRLRKLALGAAAGLTLAAATLWQLDRAFPPPLPERITVSAEVLDRDGPLLRAFATPDGYWRLATDLDRVDKPFLDMLVAYEDKRFWDHRGIDFLAIGRAALQFATSGHIVSGGSTLSMQLARLIEPRESRNLAAKLRQVLRALQIERRLSKREILERYLTLAPYGGNLEGVRAASLAWFDKEPKRLTVAESALLVALPQLPEKRRPDRNPVAARAARDRVLARMVAAGKLDQREAARAAVDAVPAKRHPLPALAPHLAYAALRKAGDGPAPQLTIRKSVQQGLEAVARSAAKRLGPKLSVAMVLADSRTGDILGEVGSANYFDASRSGWIDMTRVLRSPGSTLKPFIYGLAFEQGLVAQQTLIEDSPADFSGYRPKNFDMAYQGDVSIRQALQLSLNVPAIRVLDAVGPARLMARFRQAGVSPVLPVNEAPGLAIGLGRAADQSGVKIFEHSPATKIEEDAGGVIVHSGQNRVHAKTALVTTNAYTGDFLPQVQRSVIPVYLYHATTRPLRPELRRQILKTGLCFTDTRKSGGFGRLDPEGRLIPGGAVFAFGDKRAYGERHARSRLKLLFPQLTDEDTVLDSYWEGYCAVTDSYLPHMQRLGRSVFSVVGFSTRGVNLAQNLGRVVGEFAAGKRRMEDIPVELVEQRKDVVHWSIKARAARLVFPFYKAKDRLGLT